MSTTDRQASLLVAFLQAKDRPMFKGLKSDFTARNHVCLGRPTGPHQSDGSFRIAAETVRLLTLHSNIIIIIIIALPLPVFPSPKSPSGCSGLTGRDQMVSHSFRGKAATRCAGTSQYPALWLSHMSLKPPVRQGRQQNWRPLARR